MANDFYNASGTPGQSSPGASSPIRAEFAAIAAAFDKQPTLTGNANRVVTVNSGATALVASTLLALAGTVAAITGDLTVSGNTTLGDAGADSLTINAATVAMPNTPTISGNPTYSGNVVVGGTFAANGGVTLGNAAGDALTITSSAASIPNGLSLTGGVVRIGTTSAVASESLLVSHTGSNANALVVGDRATPANDTGILLRTNGTATVETSNATLRFVLGAVEKARITTGNYMGYLNTDPSVFNQNMLAGLVIGDGVINSPGITLFSPAASGGFINFADGSAASDVQYRGSVEYDHAADTMFFRTAGTRRFQIVTSTSAGPVSNNVISSGTSALRWSNVFSVLGNFTGSISTDGIINSGAVTRAIAQNSANSGGNNGADFINTANTASSNARVSLTVGGTSAGDPFTLYSVTGGADWTIGLDNSDSDAYVISASSVLGTNNVLRITTTGDVSIPLGNFAVARSANAAAVQSTIQNTSNTASSSARLNISNGGASGGDVFVAFATNVDWQFGVDISDSNACVLSASNTLGTTNVLRATTAGAVSVPLGNFSTSRSAAGGTVEVASINTDNTNAASHAQVFISAGGGLGGDARILFDIGGGTTNWVMGIDNSVGGDPFVLSASSALGTTNVLSISTGGTASFLGLINVNSLAISTATGTINGLDIGYRNIERTTGAWTAGMCRAESAGVTLNTSDMATGRTFCIYNDSGASITITQGAGVTLRLGGSATTGSRTLGLRGFATIWCNSGTEAIITGSGVS